MKSIKKYWTVLVCLSSLIAFVLATVLTVLAVAQPVLSIASAGSNQFNIVITNAVTTTNYTLFWTPVLADQNYPWQVLGIGSVGQTNFTVDVGTLPFGFFEVLVGSDSDGDGVPEWQDAQPTNPNVGILSVTIDYPTNGFTFN